MDVNDHDFVDLLDAEHADLIEGLTGLTERDWLLPTAAEGWTVADSLSHLADTEEIARHTATGGPRSLTLAAEAARVAGSDVIAFGVDKGRSIGVENILAWFVETSEYNRNALRRVDTRLRVPWGLGMSWRSFITARLMEAWAHGLDMRAALGRPGTDTDRLENIAFLGLTSLPYAFHVAGVDAPAGRSLRLELEAPSGAAWVMGKDDATDVITGPASVWCRRAVQRITADEAGALDARGPLAELAIARARCYL